jgi:hypothetical protein
VLCDAVLRTEDGGAFPVHRTVLLIHSEFFRFVCLEMQFTNVGSSDISEIRNIANKFLCEIVHPFCYITLKFV